MLVQTSAGAWLADHAAQSYEALNNAFRNHFGYSLSISSGARTYAQQEQIFRENYNPFYTVAEYGRVEARWFNGQWWYRKAWKPTTAVPGTSNHEFPPGVAADFGSGVQYRGSDAHNWMLANAGHYGWEWTGQWFATVEPWHWEKRHHWAGVGPVRPLEPAPAPKPKPVYTPKENDDMGCFRITNRGEFYIYSINDAQAVSQEEATAIARAESGTGTAQYKDGTDVFRRITRDQAVLIINGVKARRSRMYKAIARSVGSTVAPDLKKINEDLDAILEQIAKDTGAALVVEPGTQEAA